MSRHATLERFIRGAVAFQVAAAAATQLPSLDTSAGITADGERIENASPCQDGAKNPPREALDSQSQVI